MCFICARIRARVELLIFRLRIFEFLTRLSKSSEGQSDPRPVFAPSTAVLSPTFHSTISLCLDFIHPPQRLTASFFNKLQHLSPFLTKNTSDSVRCSNGLPFYVIKTFPWTCYLPKGYRLVQSVKEGNSMRR